MAATKAAVRQPVSCSFFGERGCSVFLLTVTEIAFLFYHDSPYCLAEQSGGLGRGSTMMVVAEVQGARDLAEISERGRSGGAQGLARQATRRGEDGRAKRIQCGLRDRLIPENDVGPERNPSSPADERVLHRCRGAL